MNCLDEPCYDTKFEDFGEVIAMDCTYNTNIFKIPLAVVVLMDNNGMVRFFIAALMKSEKHEAFDWLFRFMIEEGNWIPCVVFSDGDLAIIIALSHLSGVKHFLCLWHLLQNLNKNCYLGRGASNQRKKGIVFE